MVQEHGLVAVQGLGSVVVLGTAPVAVQELAMVVERNQGRAADCILARIPSPNRI